MRPIRSACCEDSPAIIPVSGSTSSPAFRRGPSTRSTSQRIAGRWPRTRCPVVRVADAPSRGRRRDQSPLSGAKCARLGREARLRRSGGRAARSRPGGYSTAAPAARAASDRKRRGRDRRSCRKPRTLRAGSGCRDDARLHDRADGHLGGGLRHRDVGAPLEAQRPREPDDRSRPRLRLAADHLSRGAPGQALARRRRNPTLGASFPGAASGRGPHPGHLDPPCEVLRRGR